MFSILRKLIGVGSISRSLGVLIAQDFPFTVARFSSVEQMGTSYPCPTLELQRISSVIFQISGTPKKITLELSLAGTIPLLPRSRGELEQEIL
jgi:hypothetical protein